MSGLLFCLPPSLLAAAGHVALSSYLQRIPAPPLTAPEAYAKSPAAALDALMTALNQEAELAASQQPNAAPAMPGAGDIAAAQRMAAQMEHMTDAERAAMAMQMMGNANPAAQAGMQGGQEWSAAEQDFAQRLSGHQDRELEMQNLSQDIETQVLAMVQSWGADHGVLIERRLAEEQRPMRDSCVETLAIRKKYADLHEALAAKQLPLLAALIGNHRVLVTEQDGFVDQMATRLKAVTSPVNQGGYSQSRALAARLMASHLGMTRQAFEQGIQWHENLLNSSKPASVACAE